MMENIRDNTAKIEELYKVEKELNGLIKDIAKAIISTSSLDEMSKRVYRYLKDHFGDCTFGLAVNNIVEKKVTNIYFYENEEVLETEDIPYDEGEKSKFLKTIFSKKELLHLKATKENFHLCDGVVPKAAYFSPLIIGKDVIGVFTFQLHTRGNFTEKELRVCRELIPFLTISLNNSLQKKGLIEINGKLKKLSQYDDLTGLYNRRSFYDNFSIERDKAILDNKIQYLLLMDLDNFKGVNDNSGHKAGDEALKKVSDILKKYFDQKLLGRFGGDEFIGGILGLTKQEVQSKVEKIILEIEALNIYSGLNQKKVGISIGILEMKKGSVLRNIFGEVDELMYIAKEDEEKSYSFG